MPFVRLKNERDKQKSCGFRPGLGHRRGYALRAALCLAFFSLRGSRRVLFLSSLGIFCDFLGSTAGVATASGSEAAGFFGI